MQLPCHKPITNTASYPVPVVPGQPWHTFVLHRLLQFHLKPALKNEEALRSYHHPQHCKQELRYSSKHKFVKLFAPCHA